MLKLNLGVNELSLDVVNQILRGPEEIGVKVVKLQNGTTIIDAGVNSNGGFEAGRLVTEICLGGLGTASLTMMNIEGLVLPAITVETNWPAISTLCIQAGYPLAEGKTMNFIGSGPARVLTKRPREIFDFLSFEDKSEAAVIVLQMDSLPCEEAAEEVASECSVNPGNLFMVVTPSGSLAGATQIAGRAIEDVMFTLWEVLHYDVRRVRQIVGVAPIAPVCKTPENRFSPDDFLAYGGQVCLWLDSQRGDVQGLAQNLIFESTPMYGRTFYESLRDVGFVFNKLPGYPGIFRPAQVTINSLKTGELFQAGELSPQMLRKCLTLSKRGYQSETPYRVSKP